MKRVDVGALRCKARLLRLVKADDAVTYDEARTVWADAQQESGSTIFSKLGIGAERWRFTIRAQDITLCDALWYDGDHFFLTAIDRSDRAYWVVTAARVVESACECEGLAFPGFMTEKYIQHTQETPMARNADCRVLVTPKCVALEPESVVTVDGAAYYILSAHTLDTAKNEHVIARVVDL